MEFQPSQHRRKEIHFASPHLSVKLRNDGAIMVASETDLRHYARCLGDLLVHWAHTAPDRTFLAERTPDRKTWSSIGYGETLTRVKCIAQALLARKLSTDHPVMILSGNSIHHALLSLAAMHVGIPIVPISPFYSLASSDFSKLKHVYKVITPGLIFVEHIPPFQKAIQTIPLRECELVSCSETIGGLHITPFDELLSTTVTDEVNLAFQAIQPDTVAKILFTSGSTGWPKGVINTHRMLCSNQCAIGQCWPFLTEKPPVVLDWLPWNHTFGANHNFNMILHNGGTLYIDDGKPTPGQIEATVQNLRDVSPTIYFNVPRGYDMLLSYLEKDASLAEGFFRNLDMLFYAAAPLPSNVWDRLKTLSKVQRGYEVPFVSSWGSTETSPTVTTVHFPNNECNNIGLPIPGTEIKMVPFGEKWELRIRGSNVTPGYWRQPDQTRDAFDEEGFYKIGDAGKWIDDSKPEKGIRFDGRIAEDFKLSTGTWVAASVIRLRLFAALEPLAQDVVITGHARDYIGALVFVNPNGCKQIASGMLTSEDNFADYFQEECIRTFVRDRLLAFEREASGTSKCVRRVILMDRPPSPDANEITDKGYVNQRAVLECRKELVEKLYSEPPDTEVIVI